MKSGMARRFGWKDSKGVARAILRDRKARRKVIARMLLAALLMMAAGLWLVDGMLATSPWVFLLWWAACAVRTAAPIFVVVVAGRASVTSIPWRGGSGNRMPSATIPAASPARRIRRVRRNATLCHRETG